MIMNYRPYLIVGIIINSALFLGALDAAALVLSNRAALFLGLACVGTVLLSYVAQLGALNRNLQIALYLSAYILGILGFVELMIQ